MENAGSSSPTSAVLPLLLLLLLLAATNRMAHGAAMCARHGNAWAAERMGRDGGACAADDDGAAGWIGARGAPCSKAACACGRTAPCACLEPRRPFIGVQQGPCRCMALAARRSGVLDSGLWKLQPVRLRLRVF